MSKSKKPRIAAVIDIGSNEIKLMIAQASSSEEAEPSGKYQTPKYLENLSYPLGLGRDTFQTGRIGFDKTEKACEIINNYLKVIKDYGVRDAKAIATTAVREAGNMDYILDQIKIKTGLSVHVLDDMEEKNYLYKLLTHCAGEEMLRSAMMVYIGTGNIGVSVIQDGQMPYVRIIKVGSLRMGELFGDLEGYTSDFYLLMEEYLASFTDVLGNEISKDIKYFVASGHEIGLIAELTGVKAEAPFYNIPRKKILALYNDIKTKSDAQTAADYKIDIERAGLLLPAACIYQNLLGFTGAEQITAARFLPCDAVLYEMLYSKTFMQLNKSQGRSTLLSARALAKRFEANEAHYTHVNGFAMTIFDKMKKIHGLGGREKLLLQTAAILHDTGKFINNREHYRHSCEIIRGSDIAGLSQLETNIVALISLNHSRLTPSTSEPMYAALTVENRVRVSKLAAILRLSDALDRSHTKKFPPITVKTTTDAMTVHVETDSNAALEQWSFNDKGNFFEEVFGIKAKIKVKRL